MARKDCLYFNSENANQESVNSCLNMHYLKTKNGTGMINISWGATQWPPWFRELLYQQLCV